MVASSSASSSRQGLDRFESSLSSHLQASTGTAHPFAELVSSITELWTSLASEIELESSEGAVKDQYKEILQRTIRDDALAAAETEVATPNDDLIGLYGTIKLKLDYALAFCQIGKLEDKTPFVILEDVFGYLSVPGCREVFSFLETRSSELKLPLPVALERTTGLALLRACNVLLARLSKSQDSVFCGRILSFMASAFGLGARSGVNLRGDFNTSNETVFEDIQQELEQPIEEATPEEPAADVEMEDIQPETEIAKPEVTADEEDEEGAVKDEIEDGEADEETVPEPPKKDVKSAEVKPTENPSPASTEPFYTTFWTMQSYFANPALLSATAPTPSTSTAPPHTPFSDFQIRVDRVMSTLAGETEKEKVLRGTGDGSSSGKGKDVKRDVLTGLDEVFMPKFLTSPGLLAFELADVSFRRQILVQFLILLQHLRSAYAPGGPGKITKSRLPALEPSKEKEKWLESTWERTLKELRSTYPEGAKFTETVLAILRREENWTRWKDTACPAFDLPPISDASLRETRSKRARLEAAPPPALQFSVGTPALSKLWENHNFEDISQLEVQRPAEELHDYSKRLARTDLLGSQRKRALEKAGWTSIDSDDQLSQIEDRKSSLTFRALRTASRTPSTLALFNTIKPGTNRGNYVSVLLEAEKTAARTRKEEEERLAVEGKEVGVNGVVTVEEVKSEGDGEKDKEGGAVMKEEEVKVVVAEKGEEEVEGGEAEEVKMEADAEVEASAIEAKAVEEVKVELADAVETKLAAKAEEEQPAAPSDEKVAADTVPAVDVEMSL